MEITLATEEEKVVWKKAKEEMKIAMNKKRKWIKYFMNENIKRELVIVNRKAANSYEGKFVRRLKELNPELHFKIFSELTPYWKQLQDKRKYSTEKASKMYQHHQFKIMFPNEIDGKNPRKNIGHS